MSDELLPRLHERDIDVLMQEELIFNRQVCEIFSKALTLDELRIHQCRLSVVDQTGETDLFALFSLGAQRGVLLIENKIDAAFQPRQPERYRERATALASEAGYKWIFCVLIAPRQYIGANSEASGHFDAIIAYEDLASAIASEATERSKHRAALLLRSVEQARSSYILTPAPEVTNVWQRIYTIATREFPALEMEVPSDKGSQSKWIIFKSDLPNRITIDWKITKATVDLSFWPGAVHKPLPSIDLSNLADGAELKDLGKTTAISIPVSSPPANWVDITDDQIRAGLAAANTLLEFYRAHRDFFA
jgi:hypothetical protein